MNTLKMKQIPLLLRVEDLMGINSEAGLLNFFSKLELSDANKQLIDAFENLLI